MLESAVDAYFEELKAKVKDRLRKGEEHYKGRWKTMSLDELEDMLNEEIYDEHSYKAMLAWRLKQLAKPLVDPDYRHD